MKNSISISSVMAHFLKENPGVIVSERDGSYFKYDSNLDCFLYCKPDNKVRNGWYRARGLDSYFKAYPDEIKHFVERDLIDD